MSLAVVVCPACRGASRVAADAIGHMVACPRCQAPFVAEEDIPIVHPIWRPTPRTSSASAVPVAPPRRRRRRPIEDEPESAPQPNGEPNTEVPDPEHDPHLRPVAGLPVSVLVGLALLPFGIPLFWRVAPILTGQEAALSMAVPMALAIAASALCLGVVYTIDWTATTRIKGVLMLVCLAYLSAAGLFFLKKDMMDRIRAWGGDPDRWQTVYVNDRGHDFEFRVRGGANNPQPAIKPAPLPNTTTDGNRWASFQQEDGLPACHYSVAYGKVEKQFKPDDAWFARVRDHLKQNAPAGAKVEELDKLEDANLGQPGIGRQWTLRFGGQTVRIVRVYAIGDRVYYLSAEGQNLSPNDDDLVKPFFQSFRVHK
jgi:hypothetical protein